jgi:hypothetical protein
VIARNAPLTTGATHVHSGPVHVAPPNRTSSNATKYVPAAMPLVQVYRLTRQSHGAVWETSYESKAAADEFQRPSWPEPISPGPVGCEFHA